MKLIIFLAIFHVSAYSAKVKTLLPKIIGGRDAEEFEFPYVVSIRRAELEVLFGEPYHICGGSILNTNTVLTASHCLFDPFGNHLSQPGSYIVVAGLLRMWSDTETTKTFFVSNIYKHPNFDMEKLLNDIAVLKVAPDFTFDLPSIQPISIETKRNLSEGTSCSVHGWGTLLLDYPLYPDILQTVDLKISNFDHCNQTYEGIVDPETQICAYESEKDSCYGDSGGGFVCDGLLVGIVSYGDGCALENVPGVYTKVAAFQDFIEYPEPISKAASIHTWEATTLLLIILFGINSIKV